MNFGVEENAGDVLARGAVEQTSLNAFFEACSQSEDARAFTYQEFPQHFVFHKQGKRWSATKHGLLLGEFILLTPMEVNDFT